MPVSAELAPKLLYEEALHWMQSKTYSMVPGMVDE